jgi:hypothetical protein
MRWSVVSAAEVTKGASSRWTWTTFTTGRTAPSTSARSVPRWRCWRSTDSRAAGPKVLRVLSDGARVHSVFWSVNANQFSYAVYGRTLASFAGTNPYDRYGEDPDVLNADLADIFEARPDNDELDGDWRSAMLASAQHRTGVALDAEWLGRPHRYVVLPQVPSDPLPPIATSDVDLDAAYRLASPPAQHAARVWLIRRLAADFGFDADPEIAASIAAVAADQAAASGVATQRRTGSTI